MIIGLPLVEKILTWRHTGFNVHSKVRAQTKREAERVGKYMIRPLLSLKRLFFDETEGKVRYQYSRQVLQEELLCPTCGGRMSIISFIDDHKVIDKIICHLELTFEAERPPPPLHVQHELLMAAEEREEYF